MKLIVIKIRKISLIICVHFKAEYLIRVMYALGNFFLKQEIVASRKQNFLQNVSYNHFHLNRSFNPPLGV